MIVTCDRVSEFADGELSQAEAEAFRDHLVGCARCAAELESIFALKGLAETALAPGAAREVAAASEGGRPRRPFWLWGGIAGAVACTAALVLWLAPRSRAPTVVASLGDTRSVEARLDDPAADAYRRYDQMRGGGDDARPPIDFDAMAALQKAGNTKGLVSRWLLGRDVGRARALLASAAGDHSLDNERAVVALLSFAPAEALRIADGVLAREPRAPQALWNRALALRDLRFDYAAAGAFEAVAGLGEPGWSEEARLRAHNLRSAADARKQGWEAAEREAARLTTDGTLPADELIAQFPDLVRARFYEATRAAGTAAGLARLRPLAHTLDRAYGEPGVLVGELERLQAADARGRAPLVAAFASLRGQERQPAPDAFVALATRLRKAGAVGQDLLLALLLEAPATARPGELERLAAERRDPWFDAAVAEVTLGEGRATPAEAEARATGLAAAAEAAARHQLGSARLGLQMYRAYVLLDLGRTDQAVALIQQTRLTAQSRGLPSFESPALVRRAVAYHGDSPVLAAYRNELVRMAETTPVAQSRRY